MKDKFLQLLYDIVFNIVTLKGFVPFIASLIKDNFKHAVVIVLFVCLLIFAGMVFSGCVMGDKAVETLSATVKECFNGICYEKNKL